MLDRTTFDRVAPEGPGWMAERRAAGFALLEQAEMPRPNDEAWRYLDLEFEVAELALSDGTAEALEVSGLVKAVEPGGRATLLDGSVESIIQPDVGSIGAATEAETAPQFGSLVDGTRDIFAAAHQAFGHDGAVITVPANAAPASPIVIDMQAVADAAVSFPHVLVDVGENAEASVVVVSRGTGSEMTIVPQIEVRLGKAGRLRLATLQDLPYDARSFATIRASLERDATLITADAGLGGRIGRVDFQADLVGDGAHSDLIGLYFGEEDQTLDYRVVVNHIGRNTSSDVFLKGAVVDNAQSVFTGLLKIFEEATKTRTFETNRNLVLSDGAKAHSVPNLEILCDDVVCGHGSTVGPLESEQLYYAMSRGLSKQRAERMLVRGFFEEVLGRFPIEGLVEPLRQRVNRKFVTAQQEGRV